MKKTIISILLILLGLALFAFPQIPYTPREEIRHTPLTVKREKTLVIPIPVSALIIAAGVTMLALARP